MRALVLLTLIFVATYAQEASSQPTRAITAQHDNMLQAARLIKAHYESFIDTKPSDEKRTLALQVKNEIETFEAKYQERALVPSLTELLLEVDLYLDNP